MFQHVGLAHAAALSELGQLTRDPDGHAACLKVTKAYGSTEPAGAALMQRQEAQAERATAKVALWREVDQKAFIALLVTPPPNAPPSAFQSRSHQQKARAMTARALVSGTPMAI